MPLPITIKTGASFSMAFLAQLPAGTWVADCDLRKADDTLVQAMSVKISALPTPDTNGNTHSGLIEATPNQTKTWPVATLNGDVRFTDQITLDKAVIFDNFTVVVEKAITHD